MTPDEIKEGIAAYKYEQSVIVRVLRRFGPITAEEFDKIFSDFKDKIGPDGTITRTMRPIKIRPCAYSPKAFLLGSLQQPGNWAKWLQLTQLMSGIGMVDIQKIDGSITYRLANNGPATKTPKAD